MKVIAVIACYKTSKYAPMVVRDTLPYVDKVICVDDCCPENTGSKIKSFVNDERVVYKFHKFNRGVGAAMKTGIFAALEMNPNIIVKIDSDGQMDPKLIPMLIEPIVDDLADVVKGNRFTDPSVRLKMPFFRFIGNLGISFITKLSTGYWELFDPTNGFIAFNTNIRDKIKFHKLDNRYFFESDFLFRCSLNDLIISEMPMEPIYIKENTSSMNVFSEIFKYSYKNMKVFFKRMLYQYFILDFNIGSLYLLVGIPTLIFAFVLGIRISYLVINGLGTVQLIQTIFLASTIISAQSIISFLYYDVTQKPMIKIMKSLSRNKVKKNLPN